MNIQRLKQAEKHFFEIYPGGFSHPNMVAIGKKHPVDKLATFSHDAFSKAKFKDTEHILDSWTKVISRSSVISMFEKPKFKSFIKTRNSNEREVLVDSLKMMLHGKQAQGFELQLDLLKTDKMAKWSIISAVPAYFRMDEEILLKPNTVKGIIQYFELENLNYKPTPNWEFYKEYQKQILKMKAQIDSSLRPNNPAFCGFLMMSLPKPE